MDIQKWDFKADGYHPHERGLREKLTKMGYAKVTLREVKPGDQIASKNATTEDQAYAFVAGRLFVQMSSETQALHQGDILVIPPQADYRFKASGDVPTKILVARKGLPQT